MNGTEATISSKVILFVLLGVFAVTGSFLGLSDFSTRGEAREAIVAQSMISSGNWILPKAYNDAVPSKPPLYHWMSAIVSLPFQQINEFTARLPSVFCAVFALGFFLWMLRLLLSSRELLLFSLFLTFSFEWLRAGMSARVDMVHAGFLASGLLMGFFAIEKSKVRYWIGATFLFALATLGKGPVAIAIPAIILSTWIFLGFDKRIGNLLKLTCCLSTALLMTLGWYIAAYYQSPQAFMEKFWYENVARFSGTMEDAPHRHSFIYLLGMLFIGTLPWSPFVLWMRRKTIFTWPTNFKVSWKQSPRIFQFSLLSIVLIFLFYCIPNSKRSVYLLAAYPFIALVFSLMLNKYVSDTFIKRAGAICITFVVLFQGIISPLWIAPQSSERDLAKSIHAQLTASNRIYSFGFEFYGASFYSNALFLRLEDAFQPERRVPVADDILVSFERESEEMNKLLATHNLQSIPIAQATVGGKPVNIGKLGQTQPTPP